MIYIAKQEIRIQLRSVVFWLIALVALFDIFITQMGYIFFPEFIEGFVFASPQNLSAWRSLYATADGYKESVRLFYDYVGIHVYTFFVFISAFVFNRDKKYKCESVIYAKEMSGRRYMMGRYMALCILYIVLIFVFSTLAFFAFRNAFYSYHIYGWLLFFGYGLYLIVPTVMIMLAAHMLLSVMFKGRNTILLVHFLTYFPIIWQENIKSYWFKVVIRLNYEYETMLYHQFQYEILANRMIVFVLSIVLLIVAIDFYEKRRTANS